MDVPSRRALLGAPILLLLAGCNDLPAAPEASAPDELPPEILLTAAPAAALQAATEDALVRILPALGVREEHGLHASLRSFAAALASRDPHAVEAAAVEVRRALEGTGEPSAVDQAVLELLLSTAEGLPREGTARPGDVR